MSSFLINPYRFGVTDPYFANVGLLLQPTAGGSIVDLSPSPKTLTVNGQTQISTALGDPTLLFDGSGDWIDVANNNVFDTNVPFTCEIDFRMSATGNTVFFGRGGGAASWSSSNGHQFLLFIEAGVLYWMWNIGGGLNTQVQTTAPAINVLHSIIIQYDGTTTQGWLNGSRFGTSTTGYTLPTTRNIVRVGRIPSTETTFDLNGHIRRLRFTQASRGYSGTTITVPSYPFPTG